MSDQHNIGDFFLRLQAQRQKNLYNTITNTPESLLQKAKDLSQLTKKTIVDKKGHQRTVWIKTGEQSSGGYEHVRKQDEVEAELQRVISDPNMKQSDKIRALFDLGMTDKKQVAEVLGAHYSRVYQLHKSHMAKMASQPGTQMNMSKEQQMAAVHNLADDVKESIPSVSVKERWNSYGLFVDMVAQGLSKSVIAYGTGGVGKTYTMTQALKKYGLREYRIDQDHEIGGDDYDYVKITGKATPTAMYKALYEHNGKLIVFDDCDSVLQDDTSVNIFKGALDTSGSGTVTYASGKDIKSEVAGYENTKGQNIVPPRFDFNGKVIFISNLSPLQMPQPLIDSRSLACDLTMTVEETVERLKEISDLIPIENNDGTEVEGVTDEDRTAVMDLIAENARKIREGKLNARTFINLVKIKSATKNTGMDWKKAALTMLS